MRKVIVKVKSKKSPEKVCTIIKVKSKKNPEKVCTTKKTCKEMLRKESVWGFHDEPEFYIEMCYSCPTQHGYIDTSRKLCNNKECHSPSMCRECWNQISDIQPEHLIYDETNPDIVIGRKDIL